MLAAQVNSKLWLSGRLQCLFLSKMLIEDLCTLFSNVGDVPLFDSQIGRGWMKMKTLMFGKTTGMMTMWRMISQIS